MKNKKTKIRLVFAITFFVILIFDNFSFITLPNKIYLTLEKFIELISFMIYLIGVV